MPEANSGSFIMALGTLFVCVCAILASYGYKGRVTTVGIDLGTTYSVVGINRNGKVEIIPDNLGNTIFPSVVSYLDNGKILVGYDAVPMLTQRPASTIYNSKRFIGRKLDTEDNREKTVHYASTHPFKIVYPVNSSVSEYSPIAFEVLGTMLLPASQNFTKPLPTLILLVSYGASFYFLALVSQKLPLAIIYASWAGLGVFSVAMLSYFFYKQTLNWQTIIGLFLIIIGVTVVNLYKTKI